MKITDSITNSFQCMICNIKNMLDFNIRFGIIIVFLFARFLSNSTIKKLSNYQIICIFIYSYFSTSHIFDFKANCLICGEECEDDADSKHPDRNQHVCKCTTADRGKTKDGIRIPPFKETLLEVILLILFLKFKVTIIQDHKKFCIIIHT